MSNYKLAVFNNCYNETRYKKWISDGGTLNNNYIIGCGINSLVYLDVLTRENGEKLIETIEVRGTTFRELMAYVFKEKYNVTLSAYRLPINDEFDVIAYIDFLNNNLYDNCCTIAKYMRYDDEDEKQLYNSSLTPGHTIIFSKQNGILHTVDPLQKTDRVTTTLLAEKIYKVLKKHKFKYILFMMTNEIQVEQESANIVENAKNYLPYNLRSRGSILNDRFVPYSPTRSNNLIKKNKHARTQSQSQHHNSSRSRSRSRDKKGGNSKKYNKSQKQKHIHY